MIIYGVFHLTIKINYKQMKKTILFQILIVALVTISCNTKKAETSLPLNPENFVKQVDSKTTGLYLLKASDNFQVAITNFGARIVGIFTPDKNGVLTDVILGFNSIDEYINSKDPYFGPIVGRVGNRIAKGTFTLDSVEYHLAINNGVNHLHGGIKGLHKVVWDVVSASDKKLALNYKSKDMEEGYPGNLDITVTYSVEDGNTLMIDYKATTDKATPVNLTSHGYYNLNGKSNISINNLELQIFANEYTPVDSTLIPLGENVSVENTPFDFRTPKAVGTDVKADNIQLTNAGGYDHNWVIDTTQKVDGFYKAAIVSSPITGIQMEVLTKEPGIQFYGGNFFDGTITTLDGNKVGYRCAIALEPQHFPDAVNQPNFPSIILRPGEIYSTQSKYIFSVTQ